MARKILKCANCNASDNFKGENLLEFNFVNLGSFEGTVIFYKASTKDAKNVFVTESSDKEGLTVYKVNEFYVNSGIIKSAYTDKNITVSKVYANFFERDNFTEELYDIEFIPDVSYQGYVPAPLYSVGVGQTQIIISSYMSKPSPNGVLDCNDPNVDYSRLEPVFSFANNVINPLTGENLNGSIEFYSMNTGNPKNVYIPTNTQGVLSPTQSIPVTNGSMKYKTIYVYPYMEDGFRTDLYKVEYIDLSNIVVDTVNYVFYNSNTTESVTQQSLQKNMIPNGQFQFTTLNIGDEEKVDGKLEGYLSYGMKANTSSDNIYYSFADISENNIEYSPSNSFKIRADAINQDISLEYSILSSLPRSASDGILNLYIDFLRSSNATLSISVNYQNIVSGRNDQLKVATIQLASNSQSISQKVDISSIQDVARNIQISFDFTGFVELEFTNVYLGSSVEPNFKYIDYEYSSTSVNNNIEPIGDTQDAMYRDIETIPYSEKRINIKENLGDFILAPAGQQKIGYTEMNGASYPADSKQKGSELKFQRFYDWVAKSQNINILKFFKLTGGSFDASITTSKDIDIVLPVNSNISPDPAVNDTAPFTVKSNNRIKPEGIIFNKESSNSFIIGYSTGANSNGRDYFSSFNPNVYTEKRNIAYVGPFYVPDVEQDDPGTATPKNAIFPTSTLAPNWGIFLPIFNSIGSLVSRIGDGGDETILNNFGVDGFDKGDDENLQPNTTIGWRSMNVTNSTSRPLQNSPYMSTEAVFDPTDTLIDYIRVTINQDKITKEFYSDIYQPLSNDSFLGLMNMLIIPKVGYTDNLKIDAVGFFYFESSVMIWFNNPKYNSVSGAPIQVNKGTMPGPGGRNDEIRLYGVDSAYKIETTGIVKSDEIIDAIMNGFKDTSNGSTDNSASSFELNWKDSTNQKVSSGDWFSFVCPNSIYDLGIEDKKGFWFSVDGTGSAPTIPSVANPIRIDITSAENNPEGIVAKLKSESFGKSVEFLKIDAAQDGMAFYAKT